MVDNVKWDHNGYCKCIFCFCKYVFTYSLIISIFESIFIYIYIARYICGFNVLPCFQVYLGHFWHWQVCFKLGGSTGLNGQLVFFGTVFFGSVLRGEPHPSLSFANKQTFWPSRSFTQRWVGKQSVAMCYYQLWLQLTCSVKRNHFKRKI